MKDTMNVGCWDSIGESDSFDVYRCGKCLAWSARCKKRQFAHGGIVQLSSENDDFYPNYSDLIRPHLKWWFSKGNPFISGKSRLVKYYNLARWFWWFDVWLILGSLYNIPNIYNPRCSMYGIFTYIWSMFMVNVGKYTIHSGNIFCWGETFQQSWIDCVPFSSWAERWYLPVVWYSESPCMTIFHVRRWGHTSASSLSLLAVTKCH